MSRNKNHKAKNGIKNDNRIENLELLPSQGGHNKKVQEVYQENKLLKQIVSDFLTMEV